MRVTACSKEIGIAILHDVDVAVGHGLKRDLIGSHKSNHTFRATGITAYLKHGGTLERAANMANHSSTRTRTGADLASYLKTSRSCPSHDLFGVAFAGCSEAAGTGAGVTGFAVAKCRSRKDLSRARPATIFSSDQVGAQCT